MFLFSVVYMYLKFRQQHTTDNKKGSTRYICVLPNVFSVVYIHNIAGQRFATERRKLAGERGDRTAVRFSAGSGLAGVESATWRVLRV